MKFLRIAVMAVAASIWMGCATGGGAEKKAPSVSTTPTAGQSVDALFAEGSKLAADGKYSEAQAFFEQAAKRHPDMVAAHFNLGVVYERQGNVSKAHASYEQAHKLDATHTPTLLNLGRVYRAQDKFDAAIALYEEALKLPGREYDVGLLNNLSVAYRLAKKFDLAEAAARKVLSRTKDNADAYKNLALVYYDQGNYRLAEFISANAKKLDEKDPGVYNNLGMIYLKMDDRRLALAQFQKAVALDQDFVPGHMNMGAMALSYRDYENAEKAFGKAIALDPTSYEAFLAYGYALDGQKGRDPKKGLAAGAQFERVLALRSDHPDAVCGAGWAYAAEKSGWDKAVTFLEKCKAQPTTSATDQQLIDAKLKGIAAMQKSGAIAAQDAKEKPKTSGNASMLDKVSDAAAEAEGPPEATPGDPAPKN